MLFFAATLLVAERGSAEQAATEGFCSPIITGASDVTITCDGIPEEALEPLITEIREGILALAEANERAEKWAERYFELSERLDDNAAKLDAGQVRQASEKLLEGDLLGAETLIADAIRQREADRRTFKAEMLSVLRQLSSDGIEAGGVVNTKFLWAAGQTIEVCFFNGSQVEKEYVARTASIWSLHGNFEFNFGSFTGGFNNCAENKYYDIRIDLEDNRNFSYVGTSAYRSGLDSAKPTMGLSAHRNCCDDPRFQETFLHEFRHALSLYHVNAHPEFCEDHLDWEAMYTRNLFVGWTKERIHRVFFADPEYNDALLVGSYDRRSIMQYRFPNSFYAENADEKCRHSIHGLSLLDKLAVFQAYPFKKK